LRIGFQEVAMCSRRSVFTQHLLRTAWLSVLLALVACNDASTNPQEVAPAAAGTVGASGTAGTAVTAGTAGAAGTLARDWRINAGDWFNARLPGVPLSCDGPAVLAFRADGTFTWSSEYTCSNVTSGLANIVGRFTTSGTYTATGHQLTLTITANTSQSRVGGGPWMEVPAPLTGETGTYAISGNRLTLTFPAGAGGGTFTTVFTSET
jgi:hypothetical protein